MASHQRLLRGVIFDYGNTLIGLEPALRSRRTDYADVVALPGAVRLARFLEREGAIPAGLKNNREFVSCAVEFAKAIPLEIENLLYDPQTSGGLLISVARENGKALEDELRGAGVEARIVGDVRTRGSSAIVVY